MFQKVHYFPAGDIEVGSGRGYRWTQGYSRINPENGRMQYPWVSRRAACAECFAEGKQAAFHATKELAVKAAGFAPTVLAEIVASRAKRG